MATVDIIDNDVLSAEVGAVVINGGSSNRSGLGTISIDFGEPVTWAGGGLRLFNHTTGMLIDTSSITPTASGTTLNWEMWDGTSGITFPDGRYTLEVVNTDVMDAGTNPLTSSFAMELHVLRGDVDGDAKVATSDFGTVSTNFDPTPGDPFREGDASGDGIVATSDFGEVSVNFFPVTMTPLDFDWGDAADPTFPTLSGSDGANHVITGNSTFLGTLRDAEADGQPTADASGDGADEDGVAIGALTTGSSAPVTVTASAAGYLNAWVDFNQDGDWDDAGEQVFTDVSVAAGANSLSFSVPSGAALGTNMARFRLTESTGYSYTGLAPNGEVEDYELSVVPPSPAPSFAAGPVLLPAIVSDIESNEDEMTTQQPLVTETVEFALAGSNGVELETTSPFEQQDISESSDSANAIDDAFASEFADEWSI